MTTVVTYEDLVVGSHEAWRALASCLSIDADEAQEAFAARRDRKRVTTRHIRAGKLAGALLPWRSTPDVRAIGGTVGHFLDRGDRFGPSWSEEQHEWANEAFGSGNRLLSNEYGLDLHRHGYPGFR